ncbi:hypothetical protein [Burkholderia cepacia]|uniref:hypothetical protein n=1 Tax=Burkholderia cepacia TaxID=292 RepID=UPI003B58230F
MELGEALAVVRNFSEDEFNSRVESQNLPAERRNLLFRFVKGDIKLDYTCRVDVELYALKSLDRNLYASLSHYENPYSRGEFYEYDPPKNGQNLIKHGLGFGEVHSYTRRFGTLVVPCPDITDGERCVIFSDLDSGPDGQNLQMPHPGISGLHYTLTIAQQRGGRFRFISSRFLSREPAKYREAMRQAFKNIYETGKARNAFIDRCVEIVERDLF